MRRDTISDKNTRAYNSYSHSYLACASLILTGTQPWPWPQTAAPAVLWNPPSCAPSPIKTGALVNRLEFKQEVYPVVSRVAGWPAMGIHNEETKERTHRFPDIKACRRKKLTKFSGRSVILESHIIQSVVQFCMYKVGCWVPLFFNDENGYTQRRDKRKDSPRIPHNPVRL